MSIVDEEIPNPFDEPTKAETPVKREELIMEFDDYKQEVEDKPAEPVKRIWGSGALTGALATVKPSKVIIKRTSPVPPPPPPVEQEPQPTTVKVVNTPEKNDKKVTTKEAPVTTIAIQKVETPKSVVETKLPDPIKETQVILQRCKTCDTMNIPTSEFCTECGTNLKSNGEAQYLVKPEEVKVSGRITTKKETKSKFRDGSDPRLWPRFTKKEVVTAIGMMRFDNADKWIVLRDSVIFALLELWGKRISEILSLKAKNVRRDGEFLKVDFHVKKKVTKKQRCPNPKCEKLNGKKAKFCGQCATSLEGSEIIQTSQEGEEPVVTKSVLIEDPLAKIVLVWYEWIQTLKEFKATEEPWLIPISSFSTSVKFEVGPPDFTKHISRNAMGNMFSKYEQYGMKRLWPHLFRHQLAGDLAVVFKKQGKNVKDELKEFFNISREMSDNYTKMTQEQRDEEVARDTLREIK